MTCAVSQAECILYIFEISYEIDICLNFSIELRGIILILLNIKPVYFH